MKRFHLLQRQISNIFWVLDNYLPKPVFNTLCLKLQSRYNSYLLDYLKKTGPGRIYQIDEVTEITPRDFFFKYYLRNKPLIIKGATKDWQCSSWTLDTLSERFGNDETVITAHGDMKTQTLSTTIEEIRTGSVKNARVANILQNYPELREEADFGFLKKYIPWPSFTTSYQFFIGGNSNFTPLHAGMTNNFSIQLRGKKRWRILPTSLNPIVKPIANGGPLLTSELNLSDEAIKNDETVKYLDLYEANLSDGDILFNPSFFWHYIDYQSESITIGLRWLNVYSCLKSSMLMCFLVFGAYNPSAFKSFLTIRQGKSMPFYK